LPYELSVGAVDAEKVGEVMALAVAPTTYSVSTAVGVGSVFVMIVPI